MVAILCGRGIDRISTSLWGVSEDVYKRQTQVNRRRRRRWIVRARSNRRSENISNIRAAFSSSLMVEPRCSRFPVVFSSSLLGWETAGVEVEAFVIRFD